MIPFVSPPEVSIVVPTYQEADNLRPLVEQAFAALASTPFSAEMIVVDDDSADGSEELVGELARRYPVRIIVRRGERGLSTAVIRGFREASGRLLLCMDADLSHPPRSLPDVIRPVADGRADFTIGSRFAPGGSVAQDWSVFRRLNSWVARLLARPLTPVRDPMAGLFCLRRETFEQADTLNPIGYKIALELLVKGGCERICEVPIPFVDRSAGESKLNLGEQWRYLRHLQRLYVYRWPVGARLAPVVAVVAGLVGIFAIWNR